MVNEIYITFWKKTEKTDVDQSVRQTLSNQPTIETTKDETYKIPFSFHTHISMEVYVQDIIKHPWQ